MGITTVSDILTSSLRALGVLFEGETPSAAKIQGALDAMNLMTDELSDIIVYASVSEDLTLIPGQAAYTIGTGGNFNTGWPTNILNQCYVRDISGGSNVDYPVSVIGEAEYNSIDVKDTQSIPESVWYDPQYPLGVLTFYYVPDKAYTFHLVSDKTMSELTSLTAAISLPPIYKSFLKWNTAQVLGADYPGAVSQPNFALISAMAQRSLSIVQRINAANKVEQAVLNCPKTKTGAVDYRGSFLAGRTD